MFCKKCGSQIPDDTVFCPNCGEMTNPNSNPSQPIIEPVSMKWFKFLINFSLILGAIINVISGISFLSGTYYGENADLVYSVFGNLKMVDVIMGVLSFALAALCVYTRVRLAGYYVNGPKMITYLYLANAAINIIYIIGLAIALPSDVFGSVIDSSTYTSIITAIIMIFVNKAYFKKRSHLFVN